MFKNDLAAQEGKCSERNKSYNQLLHHSQLDGDYPGPREGFYWISREHWEQPHKELEEDVTLMDSLV